ncbi:Non-specific serine/threonine protein kinase protein [Dioscorea alata]|uniref:Non-specific serine/threonine protein kinase protein n=1 Tax=Dioscorea alata TaxID=55571 RepID=A0ACB7V6D3_DIOAL|nr:Non-specific serine/threonine protein kinase protein [Dioscorea alata]
MGCCTSTPKQQENPNSGDDGQHNTAGTNVNPPDHSQSPAGQAGPSRLPPGQTGPSRLPSGHAEPLPLPLPLPPPPGHAGPLQLPSRHAGPLNQPPGHAGPLHLTPGHAGPLNPPSGHAGPLHLPPRHAGPLHLPPGHAGPLNPPSGHAGPLHLPPRHAGPLEPIPEQAWPLEPIPEQAGPSQPPAQGTTSFRHYNYLELVAATQGYANENILATGGGLIPNYIYWGRLRDGRKVAIKRFSEEAWPIVDLFKEEAIKAGKLRHRRLVSLIGYCCQGDERLLVAEFKPNDSLAKHLFNGKRTMKWSMRLRVAHYIAEALEYCCNEGQALYHDLTPYKVLFDEGGNACLSCFGLVKNRRDGRCFATNISYYSPDIIRGRTTRESMIFNFGLVLHDLLSGEQISVQRNVELIMGRRIPIVLDPRLKGKCSAEEATALEELAHQCQLYNHTDRPTIEDVIATIAQIQSNAAGPSNPMPNTGAR